MSASFLSAPHFHSEGAAFEYVEARPWKHGRVCPRCGVPGESGKVAGRSIDPGRATRILEGVVGKRLAYRTTA
jgi:hypothetical protein